MRHKIENIHKDRHQKINFLEMNNKNNIKSLKSSQKKYQIMALKVQIFKKFRISNKNEHNN